MAGQISTNLVMLFHPSPIGVMTRVGEGLRQNKIPRTLIVFVLDFRWGQKMKEFRLTDKATDW